MPMVIDQTVSVVWHQTAVVVNRLMHDLLQGHEAASTDIKHCNMMSCQIQSDDYKERNCNMNILCNRLPDNIQNDILTYILSDCPTCIYTCNIIYVIMSRAPFEAAGTCSICIEVKVSGCTYVHYKQSI